LKLKKLKN